jgi:DNA adenine methylase
MSSDEGFLPGLETSASLAAAPAVLRYPGAKWSLANKIAANFPPHFHYVEPFFGSGAVFFTKSPSGHELINDLNSLVVNLFTVLRDQTDDLIWALETTAWSREEYDKSDQVTGDPLEDARRFVVRIWQAHASDLAKKTGWKNRGVRQSAAGMSHRWAKVPNQLSSIAWRLSDAEIENRPALEVIKRFSADNCLIYADPPYLHEVRTQDLYSDEMSQQDHIELLEALHDHKGPVVLSGYDNNLYKEMLKGWKVQELKAPKVEKGASRTEILWIKET